jgi:CelD/BcsL family acetyltransferase involved in cellulose biosynthesis
MENRSEAARFRGARFARAGMRSMNRILPMSLAAEMQRPMRGEVLGREDLPTLLPAWRELCARSAEDNVYYTPHYAQALLGTVEKHTPVRFAVVWDGPQLVALLPVTPMHMAIPLLQPAGRAWRTDYTFSCTPLLDRSRIAEAADALLDVLATVGRREWIIATVNSSGPVCQALMAALRRRGRPWRLTHGFQRASLEPGPSFDAHMHAHVSAKRRRDLARNRRRLEKLGAVAIESHSSGDGLARAVSSFLTLEAGGWKGTRGTALACREDTADFALQAFAGEAPDVTCRADVLTLDGGPIAVSLTAIAGRTGFTVKCCYDEAYRSYSVGLLLEVEVIRSLLTEKWAARLDAATAGTHVIDGLWPGRVEVADFIFSLSSMHSEMRVRALKKTQDLARSIRDSAKRRMIPLLFP